MTREGRKALMRGDAGSDDRSRRAWAVASIAAMLAWFGLTNHVHLEPLNDLSQQGDQLASTLSGVIPFGLAALTIVFVPDVWLALQIVTWWIPYLFGASAEHWGGYSDTLSVLPTLDGRLGPDVQHLVLQVLSLAMAVMLTTLTSRLWRNRSRRRRADRSAFESRG